ncbi:SemiSWEET family sugar transporter [Allokutzneria oryzae]|uniref:SemiSWEET family sugar transporter n=1 Tax=Allokutzneria oryzae TaxID=1378989 RepID=A0ABV5ZPF1_9PSEU
MTTIGFLAGVLTTACWVPQLLRSWRTRSTADFSWLYLVVITVGVAFWAVYGVWRQDVAVIAANVATLCFLLFLIGLKLSERRREVAR